MDNLMSVIARVNHRMNEFVIKELRENGIEELVNSHGSILYSLRQVERMNYKELSKKIGKSPQTMTTLIRKLINEGYVSLEVSRTDKRNKFVSLTKLGKEVMPTMDEISRRLYQVQYQGFTENEEMMLRELIQKLYKNFEDEKNEDKRDISKI